MGKTWLGLLAGLALVVSAAVASAQQEQDEFAVNIDPGWRGLYRPSRWMPLNIEVRVPQKLKKFDGTVKLSSRQDEMTNIEITQAFSATADLPRQLVLATKTWFSSEESIKVSLIDLKGRSVYESQMFFIGNTAGISLKSVPMENLLIGVVRSGPSRLNRLSNFDKDSGNVAVGDKLVRVAPYDWTGYDCLDLLILEDLDWAQLGDVQCKAIIDWVSKGGTTLIVLGSHPMPPNHPLAKMLPFAVSSTQAASASNAGIAEAFGISSERGPAVQVFDLSAASKANWTCLGKNPVVMAWGNVGFGQVGVLAFNPYKSLAESQAAEVFKSAIRSLTGKTVSSEGTSSNAYQSKWHYSLGQSASNANEVMGFMLSDIRPLSIWWIIAPLIGLAVLLGPVDYFVLKRLDRQPWTWVTSGACIVLFSVGAYFGVEKIRSGDLTLKTVSVLDSVQGVKDSTWVTDIAGIHSPGSTSYRLEGLGPQEWWSSISPTSGNDIYSYRSESSVSRNLFCRQLDGGNVPVAIPISIWSVQGLHAESSQDAFPFQVAIREVDVARGTVRAQIVNRSKAPIVDGCICVQLRGVRMMMPLGQVAPGAARDVVGELTSATWNPMLDPDVRYESRGQSPPISLNSATSTWGTQARSEGIERRLSNGDAVVCVRYDAAPLRYHIAKQSAQERHVQIARLVVPAVLPKQ